MQTNRLIIVPVIGIGAIAAFNALVAHKPITRILIGTYALFLILSLFDLLGGGVSQVTGGIAMTALLFMIITQLPWDVIGSLAKGGTQASGTAGGKFLVR